jgi:hypothetical protein
MAEPVRHRQTKGAETDMCDLPPPRHISTLRTRSGPCVDSRTAGLKSQVEQFRHRRHRLRCRYELRIGESTVLERRAVGLEPGKPEITGRTSLRICRNRHELVIGSEHSARLRSPEYVVFDDMRIRVRVSQEAQCGGSLACATVLRPHEDIVADRVVVELMAALRRGLARNKPAVRIGSTDAVLGATDHIVLFSIRMSWIEAAR